MTYPHRVRRLVLVSPVGWADKPSGELARGRAGGLFGALWDAGVGNFGLLKTLGRFASGAAKNIVVGRLGIRDEEERKLVQDYFWSLIASQPLSADKNINYLLEPYFSPAPFGFYAKRPVCTEPAERLRKLPPTTLLYGSHDLHYIPTMPEAIKAVANHASCTMKIVEGSDHHIYIDNPRKFHEHVAQALGA
jgi:pimeloyl-ACP methyl ester carboxylesterase